MNQVLNLQMQLLLHQHGRREVIEALATVEDADIASIHNEIKSMRSRRKNKVRGPNKAAGLDRRKTSHRPSAKELIEAVSLGAETKSLVEQIVLAYERKQFLPELRHVRQYLEEAGKDASKLSLRSKALPEVIAVLAVCPREKLEELVGSFEDTGGRNDLAVLTGEILGPADGSLPHPRQN